MPARLQTFGAEGAVKAFIKRRPVVTYFALAFAISWGGMLLVLLIGRTSGISGTTWKSDLRLPFVLLALGAGPSVASLLLIGLLDGRAGYRELVSRLLRWRLGARWYAAALLTAPLLVTPLLFALSRLSPGFLPAILTTGNKASLLILGIASGLLVGFIEELGWTGFAMLWLKRRYGVLATGLIVGILWGTWHLEFNAWTSSTSSGGLPQALFLPLYFFNGRGTTDGIPGAHGLGLRPNREPARGDSNAGKPRRQHCHHPRTCRDRRGLLDLVRRLDGYVVGRRCRSRHGQPQTALAATAREAGSVN